MTNAIALPRRAMVTSPHHLASEAGLRILKDGGNAIEAAVATAAALAVVYPHMNGIGGDSFWLISEPGKRPTAISACGFSGERVVAAIFPDADAPPGRGPLSANTVAGTVDGWRLALEWSRRWGGRAPLAQLLSEAIYYAEDGYPVSAFQAEVSSTHGGLLSAYPGFADHFLGPGGAPTPANSILKQPALARSLRLLVEDGLDGFYRGRLAAAISADFEACGLPLTSRDLEDYRAECVTPLSLKLDGLRLYNHPPPTQGLASLIILALAKRLELGAAESFGHIHGLVEATKRAFAVRDAIVTDPRTMTAGPLAYLDPHWLDAEAAGIDMDRASDWQAKPGDGDTVWLGTADSEGRMVSMIQSVFLKFGSGVVLPETGILWQNRGAAFSLDPRSHRFVGPRRLPFHTLNPAMADFADGRRMVYGTMGGDGQPQFQAALFSRYAFFGQDLQASVAAPRWLLSRFYGEDATKLRVEDDLGEAAIAALAQAGHDVIRVPRRNHQMGHAGAIVRDKDGGLTGAADPRSDGSVAALEADGLA